MPKLVYDCFLSHNSDDKPAVAALADCATCCVCIGPGEIGPWQNEEMRAAIGRRVSKKRGFRVIPVLLPGTACPERSKLPTCLTRRTWVEFRKSVDEECAQHDALAAALAAALADHQLLVGPMNESELREAIEADREALRKRAEAPRKLADEKAVEAKKATRNAASQKRNAEE